MLRGRLINRIAHDLYKYIQWICIFSLILTWRRAACGIFHQACHPPSRPFQIAQELNSVFPWSSCDSDKISIAKVWMHSQVSGCCFSHHVHSSGLVLDTKYNLSLSISHKASIKKECLCNVELVKEIFRACWQWCALGVCGDDGWAGTGTLYHHTKPIRKLFSQTGQGFASWRTGARFNVLIKLTYMSLTPS